MNEITKNHIHLHISLLDQEFVHPAALDIGGVHRMGYTPVSKVLSTYTPMKELALALAQWQAQLVIHHQGPQLGLHRRHRHRHHVRHDGLVVLDILLITQNRVAPREVSPKTMAKYKINRE